MYICFISPSANFEFVKIVKTNGKIDRMVILYFITFVVKQIGTKFPTTFEAMLLGIDYIKEVYLYTQKRFC